MASKVLIKRTSVAGRVPNTSVLDTGELALNMTDQILYGSNGTTIFEIGAKLTNLSVNTITVGNSSVNTFINSSALKVTALIANGTSGTDGQALFSNGTVSYWGSTAGLTTNVNAQFSWSNTHTFSNTVTFNGIVNANNASGTNGQVLTANSTGGIYWANSTGGASAVTINTFVYSITSNTTSITGSDNNAAVLVYILGREDVYLNGIKLVKGDDYTTPNTSTITLSANAQSGDIVEVVAISGTAEASKYKYSISTNTVNITGADDSNVTLSYTPGQELVYLNGLKLIFGSDYSTPNTSHIVLTANAATGDSVEVLTFPPGSGVISDLANSSIYGSSNTSILTIDTFNAAADRTAKYVVQANTTDSFHSSEALVIHDGTTAYITEYGAIYSNGSLFSLSADISGGEVRLRATPTRSGTTFKHKRIILGL